MGNLAHSRWGLSLVSLYRVCIPIIILLALGIAASLILFSAIQRTIDLRVAADFERGAEERVASLRNTMNVNLLLVETLASFYRGSERVERHEFKDFTATLLSKKSGIHAFEWVPRGPNSERAAFEAQPIKNGVPGFERRDQYPQGNMVR